MLHTASDLHRMTLSDHGAAAGLSADDVRLIAAESRTLATASLLPTTAPFLFPDSDF